MSSACKYLGGRMYKHRTTRDENKQRKFTFLCLPCFVCYLQSIKIAETVKMCFFDFESKTHSVMVGVSRWGPAFCSSDAFPGNFVVFERKLRRIWKWNCNFESIRLSPPLAALLGNIRKTLCKARVDRIWIHFESRFPRMSRKTSKWLESPFDLHSLSYVPHTVKTRFHLENFSQVHFSKKDSYQPPPSTTSKWVQNFAKKVVQTAIRLRVNSINEDGYEMSRHKRRKKTDIVRSTLQWHRWNRSL